MKTRFLSSPVAFEKTVIHHRQAIERLQMSITKTAVFNFFIVSLVGVLLRAYPIYSIPFPSFKNLLHAHSHFAFGGWVMPALLAMLLKYFPEVAQLIPVRHLRNICLLMFMSSYGMLISFPFQGYALISIVFSSLSIVSGFYLTYIFWIGTNDWKGETPIRFIRAGLIYLTISAIGPIATGPLIATGQAGSPIYFNSIYFFLHFQYNGWFTFAILAIIYRMINRETRTGKWAFALTNVSCVPAYFLSTLWNHPGIAFNIVGGIAATLQLVAVCLIVYDVRRTPGIRLKNGLSQLAMIFLVAKNVLQFAGSFPYIADLAHRSRNFTIAYLHMVLLGFVTLFLIGAIIHRHRIKHPAKLQFGIRLLIVCFIVTEILLVMNASGYNIAIGPLQFPALLLITSTFLPLSIFVVWKEIRLLGLREKERAKLWGFGSGERR